MHEFKLSVFDVTNQTKILFCLCKELDLFFIFVLMSN